MRMQTDRWAAVLRRDAFRPLKTIRLQALGLCFGALALAGCETSDLPFVDKPVILPCPNFFVLEDAANLTQFRGGTGRDITDILVSAEMGEIRLGCLSNVDSETNAGVLELDVSPIILAEMGASNTEAKAKLPYFVVITDPDKEILYREELNVEVSFEGNRTRLVITAAPTTLELPITPEIRSKYYLVYAGFVLTPEELEFNRRRIRDKLQ